jgi:hypothetical protein
MPRKSVFSDEERALLTQYIPEYQSQSGPDFFTMFAPLFLRQFPVLPTCLEILDCEDNAEAAKGHPDCISRCNAQMDVSIYYSAASRYSLWVLIDSLSNIGIKTMPVIVAPAHQSLESSIPPAHACCNWNKSPLANPRHIKHIWSFFFTYRTSKRNSISSGRLQRKVVGIWRIW